MSSVVVVTAAAMLFAGFVAGVGLLRPCRPWQARGCCAREVGYSYGVYVWSPVYAATMRAVDDGFIPGCG